MIGGPLFAAITALLSVSASALAQGPDRFDRDGRVIILQQDLIRHGNVPSIPDELVPDLPTPEQLAGLEIDSSVRHLAAQLADPDFTVREEAMQALLAHDLEIETLCALLQDHASDPEARNRLLLIFRQQMLGRPRGAVGISINRNLGDRGRIIIDDLIEDLPAERVLQVGDEITHLNGEQLKTWYEFVSQVQFKRPGERISLTVERLIEAGAVRRTLNEPTRTVEVDLELGSADKLIDERTGRPQNSALIDRALTELVRQAERRFQPSREQVFVPMAGRGAFEPDSEARRTEIIAQVNRGMAKLQAGFEIMQRNQLELDEGMRRVWDQQILQLEELAMEPALSASEQQDLLRKLLIYRQLFKLQ